MNHQEAYGTLGEKVSYDATYNPKQLFAIARAPKRAEIGIQQAALPFFGVDVWNHYEVSWLNSKGKPCVAVATIMYDASSAYLVESKSLKLYFNSLNQTQFISKEILAKQIAIDLKDCLKTEVIVELTDSKDWQGRSLTPYFSGVLVDDLDVACHVYDVDSSLLKTKPQVVKQVLCSDLLRSNCPVTNQPDWGSVQVSYTGPEITPESFLKYIVSFRNHQGFHEQCIEQIFIDIQKYCKPETLTVYGRYTRRGGLDINPYRSTEKISFNAAVLRLDLMRQ